MTSTYKDGWFAHKNEVTQDQNPFNEQAQNYSYIQWLSGWCGRFEAIKHNKSLNLDEELFQ